MPNAQNNGARTNYFYSYGTSWTTGAVTYGTSANHWTQTTLDGLGRTTKTQTGTGSTLGSNVVSEVDTTYAPCACSPLGKISTRTGPYAPGQQNPPSTANYYDALGRTTSIKLADGSTTSYTYQGNVTTITDPAGKWKQYTNDAYGNLVTVLEPDPAYTAVNPPAPTTGQYPLGAAPANSNTLFTGYNYDPLNHLATVGSAPAIHAVRMQRSVGGTMQAQTRDFNYDATTQRLTSATNPENGTVYYYYNTDGTLHQKRYGTAGKAQGYEYDLYQRLSKIHAYLANGNEDVTQLQTFNYDPTTGVLNSVQFVDTVGPNQLQMTNKYTYTPAGNVASKTLSLASDNHPSASGSVTANYTYDSQGALMTIAYPGPAPSGVNYKLTYALDPLERPSGLTDNNSMTWVSTSANSYNAANQLLNATFPSGAETWTYNNLLQLTQRTTVSGGTTLQSVQYNYAAGANNGQVNNTVDGVTGETITYNTIP